MWLAWLFRRRRTLTPVPFGEKIGVDRGPFAVATAVIDQIVGTVTGTFAIVDQGGRIAGQALGAFAGEVVED